jgi:hypothetical protein
MHSSCRKTSRDEAISNSYTMWAYYVKRILKKKKENDFMLWIYVAQDRDKW